MNRTCIPRSRAPYIQNYYGCCALQPNYTVRGLRPFKRNSEPIKKNRIITTLLLAILLFVMLSTSIGQKVWLEDNGFVIIEAENVWQGIPENSDWKTHITHGNFSGLGYVKWEGTSMVGHNKDKITYADMPEDRILCYLFKITKPGRYYWRVRNIHEREDGDNDCFVSMNKTYFEKVYDWDTLKFTWDETGQWASRILEPGIYEIALAGRSEGFAVDRIVIFHEDLSPKNWGKRGPYSWMNDCIWAREGESEFVFRDF